MADDKYEKIVYENTVVALLAGATLIARDGVTKYSILSPYAGQKKHVSHQHMMTKQEQLTAAKIIASYVVG